MVYWLGLTMYMANGISGILCIPKNNFGSRRYLTNNNMSPCDSKRKCTTCESIHNHKIEAKTNAKADLRVFQKLVVVTD